MRYGITLRPMFTLLVTEYDRQIFNIYSKIADIASLIYEIKQKFIKKSCKFSSMALKELFLNSL